jgi:hypothetical protein
VLGLRPAEAVDRLEERDFPTGFEHAEHRPERRLLDVYVDQHRARRDNIDSSVRDWLEMICRGSDEFAPRRDACLLSDAATLSQKVLRDVAEDHPAARSHPVERTEGDKAIAGSKIH